jgi:hypothetical protein
MTVQYCPYRHKLGMTWCCDDDDLTFWHCCLCNYGAQEITKERCEDCNGNSVLVLKDKERQYRFCLKHEH